MIKTHLSPCFGLVGLALSSCGAAEREPASPGAASATAVASVSPQATEPVVETPEAPPPRVAATAAQVPAGLALPERFTAIGTEPFWAAKAEGGRLTYSTPDDQAGKTIPITRMASPQVIVVTGTLAGQRLVLTITAGPCSDGMSDRVYPLSVLRRLGDDEQRGCARAT